MEVKYNVKTSFKHNTSITNEELKDIFNKKWLNVVLLLEKQNNLSLNKS